MTQSRVETTDGRAASPSKGNGLFGSLRDALAAAGRADQTSGGSDAAAAMLTPPPVPSNAKDANDRIIPDPKNVVDVEEVPVAPPRVSAKEAAAAARGQTKEEPMSVAAPKAQESNQASFDTPPTTGIVKKSSAKDQPKDENATQFVRGRAKVKRGNFTQDPVVAWLVVVGGPGLGSYRPVFEGNNTIGRAKSQRIPLDFGDEAISGEEQAYIRYDSAERNFLFVPNLSKTNIVSVNEKRPTGATELSAMDVITIGRTQLVFVPFCGSEFDWSELPQS